MELAGVGTGIVLCLAAAALPYALLGVAVVGARLRLAYAASHDIPIPLGTWMLAHRLTTHALIDVFFFLVLAMVLIWTGSLAVRSRELRAQATQASPPPQAPKALRRPG